MVRRIFSSDQYTYLEHFDLNEEMGTAGKHHYQVIAQGVEDKNDLMNIRPIFI